MQKEIVDKIIDKLCTDTENMFECSPKVSPTKTMPNFILLLELVSLNSENEERINKILQSYYYSEYLKEIRRELSNEAWRILFKDKTYGECDEICKRALKEMGIDGRAFWYGDLRTFISGRQGSQSIRLTDEFKIKLCKYLGLDTSVYLPSKAQYKDYLLQRQQELMKVLNDNDGENKLEIKPDIKYQGMTSDMKEALFNKFSSFIEKTNNDAWEGRIDKDKLCLETQSLTTELIEYKKVANC